MAFSSILFLWNEWNIRGFVILSLLLQIILILFAPLRKKTKNNHIVFLLWLAYLIADSVAAFGIVLISHNEGSSCAHVAKVDRALRAFLASFLLLHLGGPDTITAFSLEDNSLWRRHLLNLTFQVGAAIYVFVQIFPSDKSLVLPTMLIFLAGVIKNVERTLALNLSSLPRLKEWVLSWQESIHEVYMFAGDEPISSLDGYSRGEEEAELSESIVVKHAYFFFQISKVFLIDLIFTLDERLSSVQYFHRVFAVDALRVISVELHFIYEVLHTKALTIRSKWSYVFRFIAFIDVAMAFVLFNHLEKHQLPKLDVKITYLLLFGGIALDVIAVLMFVFSDWTIAKFRWHQRGSSKLDLFLYRLLFTADDLQKPRFAKCKAESNNKVTYTVLDTPLLFRRWSESIYACNLLSESLEESPRKMYKRDGQWGNITFSKICSFPFYMADKTISCFHQAVISIAGGCGLMKMDGKRSVIAKTRYVSTNPFILKLWIFIFEEVRRKSIYTLDPDRSEERKRREERERERSEERKMTTEIYKRFYRTDEPDTDEPGIDESGEIERTKEIYEARGNWILRILLSEARLRSLNNSDTEVIHEATNNEFPQSNQNIQGRIKLRITMSSVTDFNYYESVIMWHLATEIWYNREDPTPKNDERNDKREFSKILSDYMFYLLFNQPNLVSAVAGIAQIKLADTLWILRNRFLGNRFLENRVHIENVKSLCEAIFSYHQDPLLRPLENHLISGGRELARELGEFREGKWEVMSRVWVEMLSYAAGHIKGEAHAQVLSKGGELLTFVWLLMIHFGLFHRPEWAPFYIHRG